MTKYNITSMLFFLTSNLVSHVYKLTLLTTLVSVLFFHQTTFAKDLTSRLGIGIKNNTSQDLPALSAVYWPNEDMGITGGIGLDTQKNYSKFTLNAGLRRILFKENQLNFYFGGQIGMVNFEDPTNGKKSGFELNAIYGAEFFLTGLDSLALNFEGGIGVASVSDVRFRTIADSPFRAGFTFYF